jgi:hypothetical protein
MHKIYKTAVIIVIISLIIILLITVKRKNQYETYLKQENENSINSILSAINDNNEVLKKYEETGEITYAELSRVGINYFNTESDLRGLQRQLEYFAPKENDNENFNIIISYFDGVSLFVSMDVLHGIGNYYPNMYNDEIIELSKDEKLILGYIDGLNQKFIRIIAEKGFINNQSNSKMYYIDVDFNNGLVDLIDLVNGLANESKNYLLELESYDNSKVVEEFLLEVNY